MIKKSSSDQILMLLKMRGELDAAQIAEELQMTKEGARQHLIKLTIEGLLDKTCKSTGVGRPVTFYGLSRIGKDQFPDTHADITVQLLQSIRRLLGDQALDLLITDREKLTLGKYEDKLQGAEEMDDKLDRLADIRSQEGYMAEWKKENNIYYFIENHCPICAAATECQQFCRAELKNFRTLLGNEVQVDREQHILAGQNRCMYRIEKKDA